MDIIALLVGSVILIWAALHVIDCWGNCEPVFPYRFYQHQLYWGCWWQFWPQYNNYEGDDLILSWFIYQLWLKKK